MFIDDQTYTVEGRTYRRVLLRNSYRKNGRTCHDTIANLSKCSDEEIAAFKFALAHKNQLAQLNELADYGYDRDKKQGKKLIVHWAFNRR